jgi:TrmH family RNA methyltransferase
MDPRRLAIVLVRPQGPANVGSVARLAANFGIADLRLVAPHAPMNEEARMWASGATEALDAARSQSDLDGALSEFGAVVATSSLRGRVGRGSIPLADLPMRLAALPPETRVALLFGPERSGLSEKERSRASLTVFIPTSPEAPVLNLSHAVAVILATLVVFARPARSHTQEQISPAAEAEAMIAHWDQALEAIGFYDTGHRQATLRDWRRIIVRGPLTRREVAILRGVANRILVSLRLASRPAERSPKTSGATTQRPPRRSGPRRGQGAEDTGSGSSRPSRRSQRRDPR